MPELTDRAVVHQLLALRRLHEAGIETIDALVHTFAPTPDAVQPCSHQVREDLSTFGGDEHWRCKQCGYEYPEATDG